MALPTARMQELAVALCSVELRLVQKHVLLGRLFLQYPQIAWFSMLMQQET